LTATAASSARVITGKATSSICIRSGGLAGDTGAGGLISRAVVSTSPEAATEVKFVSVFTAGPTISSSSSF
jgi:hypothetical protein